MTAMLTSLQNPFIKNILLLQDKPKARREQNRFVIEGLREVNLALQGGFTITDLILCPDVVDKVQLLELTARLTNETRLTEVSHAVFSRLAYRDDSGGIIALAIPLRPLFNDLQLPEKPLLLVLETVEKPGNLGAMLRTADAAGIDAVVVCDPQTDIYNPNAVRASLGTLFTLPVITAMSQEVIPLLKKSGITIVATALTGTKSYHETDFRGASAIVMGSEAFGLSQLWLDEADLLVKVPMRGKVDSMNVSVTAAVVMFEAMRQRGFNRSGF
jgi:TrmH family RNA methyltransferase